MHDPMVVAFDIRRPLPSLRSEKVREGQPRWSCTIYRKHGKDHQGWNPRRWWRPGSWSPFVTAFGRRWYFPSVVTVWHVEPHGHDSGEVCKHWVNGKHRNRWRWHVWHWKIQVSPLQGLRARLFDRCALCGRKGRPNVSHQWDGKRLGWWKFRSREGLYHRECSGLVSTRRTIEQDEELIRHLFAALRVHLDIDETDLLARLTDPTSRALEFHESYRLTHLLGYKRGDDYRLVKK